MISIIYGAHLFSGEAGEGTVGGEMSSWGETPSALIITVRREEMGKLDEEIGVCGWPFIFKQACWQQIYLQKWCIEILKGEGHKEQGRVPV